MLFPLYKNRILYKNEQRASNVPPQCLHKIPQLPVAMIILSNVSTDCKNGPTASYCVNTVPDFEQCQHTETSHILFTFKIHQKFRFTRFDTLEINNYISRSNVYLNITKSAFNILSSYWYQKAEGLYRKMVCS